MARTTPQEFADKWQRRLAASSQDVQAGINKVTVAPGMAAAAAAPAMLQGVTDAVTSGKWAKRVSGVTLADWKNAALTKGVPRIAAGAQAAVPKMAQVAQTLLPAIDAAAAAARALPKVTIEDSVNRAATFMRAMAAYGNR